MYVGFYHLESFPFDFRRFQLWGLMWSNTHGPVYSLEPNRFLVSLDTWRRSIVDQKSSCPIFLQVKNNQLVFNGYGAQETSDMLSQAAIHPVMPSFFICQSDSLFTHFKENVIDYQKSRLDLCKHPRITSVSSFSPFRFNTSAHKFFLQRVLCSRRARVSVDVSTLAELHRRNLLNPNALLQDTGDADGEYII